jgi:hypothetical protein
MGIVAGDSVAQEGQDGADRSAGGAGIDFEDAAELPGALLHAGDSYAGATDGIAILIVNLGAQTLPLSVTVKTTLFEVNASLMRPELLPE